MGFGMAVLLVGVCVLGQLDFPSAALEVPHCITYKENGSVVEMDLPKEKEWLKFAQEGLDAHNTYRKKHGVPPLVLNRKMCKSARWIAYYNAAHNEYRHVASLSWLDMHCGENLHKGNGFEPASYFVKGFYDEIKDYDFAKHKGKNEEVMIYHFTQLVWKESKEMCITYAKFNGKFHIAAHYYPTGNVKDHFAANVFNSANHDHFKTGIISIWSLCVHLL